MDQITQLLGTLWAPVLSSGGALGFYLLYRKFEAERAESLRADNKDLREENKTLREENDRLRGLSRGETST